MKHPAWERFPHLDQDHHARTWLTVQTNLGLASHTIDTYGRALGDFFAFSQRGAIPPHAATKDHIASYVRHLAERPNPRSHKVVYLESGVGLSNTTMQQRIRVVRLYYDYLIEEGVRVDNPVGRGRYTPGKGFGGHRDRALILRFRKLPWIPNEEQWDAVVAAARTESLRNRVMFALAYDAGLRREELCTLQTHDIDPAYRTLRVGAETTKNLQERVIAYSKSTNRLYMAYLRQRRVLSQQRGPLFLSESRRNHAQPLSIWTWSKVVAGIPERSGVTAFTTHTLRHLRLTDLARAGWDTHDIAIFAGHRSVQTTLLYIHVSGRKLATKLEQGMNQIHSWRTQMLAEVLA